MSYLDTQKKFYQEILQAVDKKISKGKGIKSVRKHLVKQIKHLDYLKSYE
tara:strand:+ start:79 stop:228 length:150 start_codon:yes stop_codon:yes gene_type:complete